MMEPAIATIGAPIASQLRVVEPTTPRMHSMIDINADASAKMAPNRMQGADGEHLPLAGLRRRRDPLSSERRMLESNFGDVIPDPSLVRHLPAHLMMINSQAGRCCLHLWPGCASGSGRSNL
jgi:hypothetical protein